MSRYEITFLPAARRQFQKLSRDVLARLQPAVEVLSINPRPSGFKKLTDTANTYRIRLGAYRVVYEIRDSELRVFIVKIKHRSQAYK